METTASRLEGAAGLAAAATFAFVALRRPVGALLGETDLAILRIDTKDLDLEFLANLDGLMRVVDVLVGELGDVEQTFEVFFQLDEDTEALRSRAALVDHLLERLPDALAAPRRLIEERLDGLLPDASRGDVEDPQQAHVVGRVRDEPEVREDVLDLGAVVEPQPADDPVGDVLAAELLLEEPRLGVDPVEERDLLEAPPRSPELGDGLDDQLGLLALVLAMEGEQAGGFGALPLEWFAEGARLIGGCCRTGVEDVRALREVVRDTIRQGG